MLCQVDSVITINPCSLHLMQVRGMPPLTPVVGGMVTATSKFTCAVAPAPPWASQKTAPDAGWCLDGQREPGSCTDPR